MSRNAFWITLIVVAALVGAIAGPSIAAHVPASVAVPLYVGLMILVIGVIIWSLSGNKVGRRAAPAAEADAKSFRPSPGKARIYVVRRGFAGALAGMKVAIEGLASGQLKSGQFVMLEVDPGTYTLETAMARGQKASRSESHVTVAEGEVAVIHVLFEMAAIAGTTVQTRLPPDRARPEVSSAKMVEWTGYP